MLPDTRWLIKNGAVYLVFTGQTLEPIIGGGASGCLGSSVPENVEKVGQAIFLTLKPALDLPPAKDSTKKH